MVLKQCSDTGIYQYTLLADYVNKVLYSTYIQYTCVGGWLPLVAAVDPPVTWSGTAD